MASEDYKSALDLASTYEDVLKRSRTAYAGNTAPTEEDLEAERSLRAAKITAESIKDKELRDRYYGDEDYEEPKEKRKEPLWEKILNLLSTGTYASVGAVETVLGKGTKKGLFENIKSNIEERETYGDLLRKYDAPNAVAMPLGFALDVALDPLNWATFGSALVPKVGLGLVKGGLTGAKAAVKAKALTGAAMGTRAITYPMRRGSLKEIGKEGLNRAEKLALKMNTLERKSADDFWKAIKVDDPHEYLKKSHLVNRLAESTGLRGKWSEFIKTDVGKKVVKVLEYSPSRWFRRSYDEARAKNLGVEGDDFLKGEDPVDILFGRVKRGGSESAILNDMDEAILLVENPELSRAHDELTQLYHMMGEAGNLRATHDEIWSDIRAIEKGLLTGKGNIGKFMDLSNEEKQRYINLFRTFKSDLEGYDKFVAKTLLNGGAKEFLGAYSKFIGLFKTGKIGGGVLGVTGLNGLVGNLSMTSMAGVNISDPNFYRSMGKSVKMTSGDFDLINDVFGSKEWVDAIGENPDIIRQLFGIDPRLMTQGEKYIQEVNMLTKQALKSQKDMEYADEISEILRNVQDESVWRLVARNLNRKRKGHMDPALKESLERLQAESRRLKAEGRKVISKGKKEEFKWDPDTLREYRRITRDAASVIQNTLPGAGRSTFLADELLLGDFGQHIQNIRRRAESGDKVAALYHAYLTKPSELYSRIDQSYKLGLTHHLNVNGISEGELSRLIWRFNVGKDDYIRAADEMTGMATYKLKPKKAMEIANEVYMNYLAMPGFVKIMRSFPILGAPFAAFSAAMVTQTAKTFVHNPAFFNRVQFLLSEISGSKGPLEKEALATKYYDWLDRPGMVKLPWAQDNPIYLNMENMLPHYSLQLLQNPERSYDKKFGTTLASAIDKTQIASTPEGRVMMDYVILPMMLGEAQNVFGKKLWPEDAGMPEKVLKGGVSLAEGLTPTGMGYLGLIPGRVAPDWLLNIIPNYRYRQAKYAQEGKSALGIKKSADPAEIKQQVKWGMLGFPTYKINLEYASKKKSDNK